MRDPEMTHDDFVALQRRRCAAVAAAMLQGDVGLIDGARQLSTLSHDVVEYWAEDEDFREFGVLDSETDHLPVGEQRALWAPAALVEKDADVARIEASARAAVLAACRRVVARFGGV